MTLKQIVRQKIIEDVVRYKPTEKNAYTDSGSASGFWRVLVVDKIAMRILSASTKVHDLTAEGITMVEDIKKVREPMPQIDAIYLLSPTEDSVLGLMKDYEQRNSPMYKSAHVYFTEPIPEHIFEMLKKSNVVKYKFMKACKEINIAFMPYEEQVFSLDSPDTFRTFFNPSLVSERIENMDHIAEQVATLCATLGEYPSIRYRASWSPNREFSELILKKLTAYKEDDSTMGEGPEKARSQLIILDRGFDCVSPLLHELTLQAMAYDLLPIKNDVYTFQPTQNAKEKEVLLDENDDLWVQLRHQHIAVVSQTVNKYLKDLTSSKDMLVGQGDKTSTRDLSKMIKQMPQYQKNLSKHATHLNLAEDCMTAYKGYVDQLCGTEQDLAMGEDHEGEKIRDPMRSVGQVLLNPAISNKDKTRIIALYVMFKNGITAENLNKLGSHAQLEDNELNIIKNMSKLGVNVVSDGNRNRPYTLERKARDNHSYTLSRWTPIIKDIMEDGVDDRLDQTHFPFLGGRTQVTTGYVPPASARYGNWHKDKKEQAQAVKKPRLIIFVVGGLTYSEIRSAYEVSKAKTNWEVIIGSTHILTPEGFLRDLESLSEA